LIGTPGNTRDTNPTFYSTIAKSSMKRAVRERKMYRWASIAAYANRGSAMSRADFAKRMHRFTCGA